MTAVQPAPASASSSEIRVVHGACAHDCPDTCGTITEVQDGRAIRFYADKDHPVTQGWLCAKVRPYLERVYHPERVLYPQRRVGPKGSDRWERISWDEAIAEISSRWKAIIAEYGAAAILPYSYSGTIGMLQMGVSSARLWNRMGASALERSICGAAAEVAVMSTYGARWAPDPADTLHSKLVLIWGHNPPTSGPHYMPVLREAQRRGAFVVVIDPRRTMVARSADLHIQPRPATDSALALGMMHVLFAEGLHDEAWLEANTVGWRDLRRRAEEYPPERVAQITGLPEETIVDLARRYGTAKPTLLKFADGVQRHGNGGQTARALVCLPAVVGQVGVRGGGLFYSTGGYGRWDEEAVGHASACPPPPRSINMNRLGAALTGEASDPPIQSLYIFGANPAASTPNARLIAEGLRREDLFTVVHELFITDTARYADILLPATSQLEQVDLHKAYGQRYLQYNAAAMPPLGESKSNWDVMCLLAEAMDYEEPWLHQTAEEAIAQVLDATRATNPYFEGITLQRLQAEATVPLHFAEETDVPFSNGRFPTPSGKLELRCDALAANGVDPLPQYEPPAEFAERVPDDTRLVLISGASHHFTSSSMANVPSLRAKEGAPYIEINPDDAAKRCICDGDEVVVSNARGEFRVRAVVTTDVASGVVVSPKGQWAKLSPDGRNVNWTTSDAIADLGGQSTFHSNLVEVCRVPTSTTTER